MRTLRPILLALTVAVPAGAQPAFDAELKAVDEQRYRAMVQADLTALDKLLADDLVYVHSSGVAEDKKTFLAALRSGQLRYKKISPEGVYVRGAGTLGIVRGRSIFEVEREGKPQVFRVYFTAAYQKAGAGWQLVAWQSTRLPEN